MNSTPTAKFPEEDLAILNPEIAARLAKRMQEGEHFDLALKLSKKVMGIHYSRISGLGAVDMISLQSLIYGELKRIAAGETIEPPRMHGPRHQRSK